MSDKQIQQQPWHASPPITSRPICENLNTPELLPATVHYHLDLSDNPRGNVPADISKYPGSEAREPYTDATAENPAWTSTVPMTTQRPNGQDFSPERLPSTERSGLPAPRSPEASHQTHNPRVSRRNEHSTREQEEVVELREMRLAEGMMLKSKRKELRGIRMKAGDTEGQFMNVLRVFLEQLNIEFPPKISMLYDDVQTTRDRLAGLEDDYNQAESEYDALEWKCSNRESKFYQKFSGDDSICGTSSPAESPENQVSPDGPEAQFSSAVGEVEMLKEQLNELKREYAEQIEEKNRRELYGLPISTQDASFINDFPRLQEELQCEIEAAELIAQQLRDKLKPNEPHQGSRRASDPHIPTAIKVSTVQHVTNIPQSESALASLAQQFTDKRKFINDWILDSLKYSPLEKARLKAQLGMTDLDDDTWWKLVVQHWNQDEIENPFAGKVSSPSASRVTAKAMNPSASASMHSPRAGHHAILAESTSNQIIPVRDDAGLVLPPDTKPTPKSQYSPIEDLIISVSSSFPEKVPEAQKGISLQSPGLPSAVFGKLEILEIPSLKDDHFSPEIETRQLAEPSPIGASQSTITPGTLPATATQQRGPWRDIKIGTRSSKPPIENRLISLTASAAESQSRLGNRGPRSEPGRGRQTALEQLCLQLAPNTTINYDKQRSQNDQPQTQQSDPSESHLDNPYFPPIHQPIHNQCSPPSSQPLTPPRCGQNPRNDLLLPTHRHSRSESSKNDKSLLSCPLIPDGGRLWKLREPKSAY